MSESGSTNSGSSGYERAQFGELGADSPTGGTDVTLDLILDVLRFR